jgi:hypothetical protein
MRPTAGAGPLTLPVFYTTTHRTGWLWDGRVDFPLMVSYAHLRAIRNLRPARVRWCLDSGGFGQIARYGGWTFTVREYVEQAARIDREAGRLDWAAPMDWACEPGVIHGGMTGRTRALGTGLTVGEHQRRTVENFIEAEQLWPRYSDGECPFMPVLQGYLPREYEECHALYEQAGVRLAEYPLVPVGSVCRRSSTREIRDIVATIGRMDVSTHWFGVKLAGIRLAGITEGAIVRRDGDRYPHGPASLDSAAWSIGARWGEPLGDGLCAHRGTCQNCHRYAAAYRERVLAALHDAARRQPDGDGIA